MSYPKAIQNLIDEFSKLPGIGPRTAARFAFNLLRRSDEELTLLSDSIIKLKKETRLCGQCFNLSENELCEFCSNPRRDKSVICVVEEAMNIPAIEKTKQYGGLYHVLGGVIRPSEGIGPDKLKIKELLTRIEKSRIKEIILATNPNTEGETTALYLSKILSRHNIRITRLARGLSTGSDLEYADEITISNALSGRKEMS